MSAPNPNDPVWAKQIASQTFNLTDVFGDVDTFTLPDIDEFIHQTGRSLIIFGVNIGMSVMVAVVLLLLTKPDKRHTPIFALNIAGLSLQFIRMVLACIVYNGPNKTIGVAFLGTTVLTPQSAFAPVYIYTFVTIFWYTVIMTSIILQVRIVFGAEPRAQKYLTYALGLLGLSALGFTITDQADVFKGNLAKTGQHDAWHPWVELTGRILYTVTIGVSSAIFVAKLLYLIYRRRKMGFKGFGPLQVIVIMGTQCLLVPLAFMIADYYVNIDGFVTIGETFLTCSLPLSALWASSEAEKGSPVQIRPPISFGTSTSEGTEVRPVSKRSFFTLWGGAKATQSSVHSEVEKGSFTEESDHVIVQRTLQVVSTESPMPRSTPNYGF